MRLLQHAMSQDSNLVVLLGDVGYGLFDEIRNSYPKRCINVGSSEQLMIGMAVGMVLEGKKILCYSITPFLLYRPFEFIRNYLNFERIPVKLVGSGRDKDYSSAGFTHHSVEAKDIISIFANIESYFPSNSKDLEMDFMQFLKSSRPAFLSLKR